MNPFDLEGPQFLALYAVVVLAGIIIAVILRRRARRPADTVLDEPQLHPYEVAHLAGGATATVNAVLARLVDAKVLELDATGTTLKRTGTEFKPTHPLETAVLATTGDTFMVKDVRLEAAGEVSRIRKRLEDLGLEMTSEKRSAASFLPALVLALLLVLGIMKIIVGVHRQKYVLFLGIDTVFVGIAMLVALVKPHRTIRGDRFLDRLKFRHAALKSAARSAPATLQGSDLSMAVGLFGVGVLAAGPMMGLHKALMPPRNAGAWAGGDYGGGCGGGCGGGGGGDGGGGGGCGGGGGGCGGGGCGGCGGGGGD